VLARAGPKTYRAGADGSPWSARPVAGKTTDRAAARAGFYGPPASGRINPGPGWTCGCCPTPCSGPTIIVITQEKLPVRGVGRGQHQARLPGRGGRGRGEGLPDDRRARLHRPRLPEGLRHLGRPKRGGRLSAGAAPADLVRAGAFLGRPGRASSGTRPRRCSTSRARRQVQAALRTVLAGRTAVIIAHRLVHGRDRGPGPGPLTTGGSPRTAPPGEPECPATGEYAALAREPGPPAWP